MSPKLKESHRQLAESRTVVVDTRRLEIKYCLISQQLMYILLVTCAVAVFVKITRTPENP